MMGIAGGVAMLVAFASTALLAQPMILWLRRMKFGQKILEIGPKWHMNKQNIPTMGGVLFIVGLLLALILGSILVYAIKLDGHTLLVGWLLLGLAVLYGLVGMVDDLAKIRKQKNAGLSPRQKLFLQILVAAVFLVVLSWQSLEHTQFQIPFLRINLDFGYWFYLVLSVLIIIGTDNAVNLTDGIDGLASSVTLPVALFFFAVGMRQQNIGVVLFAGALAGTLVGFLLFNFHPAKIFMGDTGSLLLGGAVAGFAFACQMPLILLLVGIVYIWETLSVILQVGYFKYSGGKRIFKMAPFHHHLEMGGWGERKIVLVATAITTVFCIMAWYA